MTDTPAASQGAPTNLVDLIDQLVEPPMPVPVSMVPQTVGWVVLGLCLVVALIWAAFRFSARHKANAYRRAALAHLSTPAPGAVDVAMTLRRTALAAFPRTQVAGLTGSDWIEFLNRTGGTPFPQDVAQEIVTAPYAPSSAPASNALVSAASDWVRHHRYEAGR